MGAFLQTTITEASSSMPTAVSYKYQLPVADYFVSCLDGALCGRGGNLVICDKADEARFAKASARRVRRAEKIKFHIEAGDYFGTLATVVDLLLQEEKKLVRRYFRPSQNATADTAPQVDGKNNELPFGSEPCGELRAEPLRAELLGNICDDLKFLQKHYKIEKK